MKLCDLLSLVATIASGAPLDKVNEVEPYKVAQIAKDIHYEQLGKDLIFRKVTGQKAELTDELFETQALPSCVLFSFMYEDKRWYAEETDTGLEMQNLLDTKVDEKSYRYVILGANLISKEVSNYIVKMDHYRGTLLVELVPTR